MTNEKTKATEEQLLYAKILSYGTWIGLATMVSTFFLYVSGILAPVVPIERLQECWGMKAKDFMHELNLPHGWKWLPLIGHGDYLNYIGVVFLAGLTVVAYAAILPILIRKKETPYVIIAIIEIVVLVLAASGILAVGGH